jgi:hypothetical protein
MAHSILTIYPSTRGFNAVRARRSRIDASSCRRLFGLSVYQCLCGNGSDPGLTSGKVASTRPF